MTRLFNLFCIGLLAAFILGSLAQAATFGGMTTEMVSMHSGTMTDCDGCDEPGEDPGCSIVCASIAVAVLPSIDVETDPGKVATQARRRAIMPGRSDPPAISPPRLRFLM